MPEVHTDTVRVNWIELDARDAGLGGGGEMWLKAPVFAVLFTSDQVSVLVQKLFLGCLCVPNPCVDRKSSPLYGYEITCPVDRACPRRR